MPRGRRLSGDAALARRLQQQEYSRAGVNQQTFGLMMQRQAIISMSRKVSRNHQRKKNMIAPRCPLLHLKSDSSGENVTLVHLVRADIKDALVADLKDIDDVESSKRVVWSSLSSPSAAEIWDESPKIGDKVLALSQDKIYKSAELLGFNSRTATVKFNGEVPTNQTDSANSVEMPKRLKVSTGKYVPTVISSSPKPLSLQSELEDMVRECMSKQDRKKRSRPAKRPSKTKRQRKRPPKYIRKTIRKTEIKEESQLGLIRVPNLLTSAQLNDIRQVCIDIHTAATKRGEASTHCSTRQSNGGTVAVFIGDNVKNGSQIYITRDGSSPAWNRDQSIPKSWLEKVNSNIEWIPANSERSESVSTQLGNCTKKEEKSIILKDSKKTSDSSKSAQNDQKSKVEEDGAFQMGEGYASRGLPKPVEGRASIRFCNKVTMGAYCKHCAMPATCATPEQWATLMNFVDAATTSGALPATKAKNGEIYDLKVVGFVVLDYGFLTPISALDGKFAGPGIPLHQDTSCLGQAIASLVLDGDDKQIDVLYDNIAFNGPAAGRCISFRQRKGEFYAMTENTRWLARHRIIHETGNRRSLGLLVRINWESRTAQQHREILRAAGEWPPPKTATMVEASSKGRELYRKLRSQCRWYRKSDFKYDKDTWDIDGLEMELRRNGLID